MPTWFAVMVMVAGVWLGATPVAADEAFLELPGTHFIVRYTQPAEKELAARILTRAEEAYMTVSRDIGFTRYSDFWTWERRVRIVVFPDQFSFTHFTGQPQWSEGYAARHSRLFHDRVIVTYDGQEALLEGILPHEIAHLVLWDLLGDKERNAPVWFHEGVAQLEEAGKREVVKDALRPLAAGHRHIPFATFMKLSPVELKEPEKVSLFYAQALSVVVFLIEKYGQDAFSRLCKDIRDGRSFEESLTHVYGGIFDSMTDLENRWLQYASGEI